MFIMQRLIMSIKMDCQSTSEENMLIFHFKRNAGQICPLTNSFQKKCAISCWPHKLVLDIEKIQNSGFFSYLKKKRLINRIIQKIKKENEYEFNYWFNEDKMDKMTEKIENNWKVNLVFLESDFFSQKKIFFSDYQPFVGPCDVHGDREHKQINIYLDKKNLWQLVIHNF